MPWLLTGLGAACRIIDVAGGARLPRCGRGPDHYRFHFNPDVVPGQAQVDGIASLIRLAMSRVQ